MLLPVNIDFILVLKGASFQGKETKNLVRASATLFGNTVKIKKVVPVSIRKAQATVSCLPHTPAGLPTGSTRRPLKRRQSGLQSQSGVLRGKKLS